MVLRMSYSELVAELEAQTGRKITSREQAIEAWAQHSGSDDPADFERACGEGSDTPIMSGGRVVPDPIEDALGDLSG